MKSKFRGIAWLAVILLAVDGVLWCRSNIGAIRGQSEVDALRVIAGSYGMSASSDFDAVLLRSAPGPNRGITKTYRVSTGSGEKASISICSFLWLGWQEHGFDRTTLAMR
jgi:hypothetical protein